MSSGISASDGVMAGRVVVVESEAVVIEQLGVRGGKAI